MSGFLRRIRDKSPKRSTTAFLVNGTTPSATQYSDKPKVKVALAKIIMGTVLNTEREEPAFLVRFGEKTEDSVMEQARLARKRGDELEVKAQKETNAKASAGYRERSRLWADVGSALERGWSYERFNESIQAPLRGIAQAEEALRTASSGEPVLYAKARDAVIASYKQYLAMMGERHAALDKELPGAKRWPVLEAELKDRIVAMSAVYHAVHRRRGELKFERDLAQVDLQETRAAAVIPLAQKRIKDIDANLKALDRLVPDLEARRDRTEFQRHLLDAVAARVRLAEQRQEAEAELHKATGQRTQAQQFREQQARTCGWSSSSARRTRLGHLAGRVEARTSIPYTSEMTPRAENECDYADYVALYGGAPAEAYSDELFNDPVVLRRAELCFDQYKAGCTNPDECDDASAGDMCVLRALVEKTSGAVVSQRLGAAFSGDWSDSVALYDYLGTYLEGGAGITARERARLAKLQRADQKEREDAEVARLSTATAGAAARVESLEAEVERVRAARAVEDDRTAEARTQQMARKDARDKTEAQKKMDADRKKAEREAKKRAEAEERARIKAENEARSQRIRQTRMDEQRIKDAARSNLDEERRRLREREQNLYYEQQAVRAEEARLRSRSASSESESESAETEEPTSMDPVQSYVSPVPSAPVQPPQAPPTYAPPPLPEVVVQPGMPVSVATQAPRRPPPRTPKAASVMMPLVPGDVIESPPAPELTSDIRTRASQWKWAAAEGAVTRRPTQSQQQRESDLPSNIMAASENARRSLLASIQQGGQLKKRGSRASSPTSQVTNPAIEPDAKLKERLAQIQRQTESEDDEPNENWD